MGGGVRGDTDGRMGGGGGGKEQGEERAVEIGGLA